MPAAAAVESVPYIAAAELIRQAEVWASHGHPVSAFALARWEQQLPAGEPTREVVPFVLVVPAAAYPAVEAMARTTLKGGPGTVNRHADDMDAFASIPEVGEVAGEPYLILDVQRGSEFCGTPPEPAQAILQQRGRTPLTVPEGIALITVHPGVLEKNHCFSLAGSRKGDRRVPAIWISKGAPHLGWCFAGAPHTWMGLASTAGRVTADGAGGGSRTPTPEGTRT